MSGEEYHRTFLLGPSNAGGQVTEDSTVSDLCAHCQTNVNDGITCDGCGGLFHSHC
ncbi:hypothetical protein DPMN_108773 [Dreissena polymorpha]|uniref:Uncharacterized protein n=1 Tax=Dreissena polymorpha TaxID=45954 RepID=A0A9D4QMC8_DREPO|nr:hypothetical protein DPMN_108773 [Dreissena polymorpha]